MTPETQRMLREAELKKVVFALYGVSSASARAGDIPEEAIEALEAEGVYLAEED